MSSHERRPLSALFDQGTRALGTWIKLATVENVELIALAGFDFVVIDLEHAPLNLETAFQQIGFAHARGIDAYVRMPELNVGYIQRVLDAGADGLLIPHVDDVDTARSVVDAARFPPMGHRGMGNTSRAGLWGSLDRAEYLRHGNEDVVIVVQLESVEAVRNAADIAAVVGVDALFLGPADLSVSEGRAQDDEHVKALIAESVEAAKKALTPIGTAVGSARAAVSEAVESGFDFVMVSNDASILLEGAKGLVAMFRDVEGSDAASRGGRPGRSASSSATSPTPSIPASSVRSAASSRCTDIARCCSWTTRTSR